MKPELIENGCIGLLGYGEVGRILAEDLRARGIKQLCTYDSKFSQPATAGQALLAHAQQHGVVAVESAAALGTASQFIICAVTADQTVNAAQACAGGIGKGVGFLDFNSASPTSKQQAAKAIEDAGGLYVEGAVMTSVPPYRIRVPLLLGGPAAHRMLPTLLALGFDAKVASETLGVASATKMCRSVMIKGLEALVIESFTAARAYGVEDQVLASLAETFPSIDWQQQGSYFFQRVIEHGRRRAEEMREVAATISEIGLEPAMASGTVVRQAWIADQAEQGIFGARSDAAFARSADWRTEADRLLNDIAKKPPGGVHEV